MPLLFCNEQALKHNAECYCDISVLCSSDQKLYLCHFPKWGDVCKGRDSAQLTPKAKAYFLLFLKEKYPFLNKVIWSWIRGDKNTFPSCLHQHIPSNNHAKLMHCDLLHGFLISSKGNILHLVWWFHCSISCNSIF